MTATLPRGPVTGPGARPARAFVAGARDIVPLAAGVAPFGLAIGAAVAASSVPTVVGWLGAPLILAGSAQLTVVQMLDGGAAPLVTIASALVINARILMYGAAMAPWFREERLARRLVLAIPLIDQLFLLCRPRFERGDLDRRARQAYYLGAAVVLASVWTLAQTIAIVGGARLPEGVGLELAAPLALAGLLAKSVSGRPATVSAAVAGVVAVAGAGLPFQAAVLVAALTGVAVGFVAAARSREEGTS